MTYDTFQQLNYLWMAVAVIIFTVLIKVTAPYGRHTTTHWGPQISNRLGWVLMEIPGMTVVIFFVLTNLPVQNAVTYILVSFYIFHYINRTFIFPFRIHTRGKKMPLVITCMAVCFNLVTGFLLGYYFGHFAHYTGSYFTQANFIVGALLFSAGMYINWEYDNKLIHLRQPGDTNYVIPVGGLFNFVSCPNLLGEIVEWTGFAILCWNLPALSFLVWTAANLIPRALSHHKWYKLRFADYPARRKAVFPYIL
ncbi:MAG: 3-oxo-5-alpha-steroid 4-dehydrogenase [Paludibacter sp.]